MHPVIVQLHLKPYIESKPMKSETKAWLTTFLKKENNSQKGTVFTQKWKVQNYMN